MGSLGIILTAALSRGLHFASLIREPIFYYPVVDARWHHIWAGLVSRGDLSAYSPYFRAPLYPWSLGLVYRLFSQDVLIGSMLSVLLGVLGAFVLYRIALRRLPWGWALAVGLIWALWGTDVFYSSTLLITTMYTTLLLLSFLLLDSGRRLSGWFILGLACIARPSALLLLPAAFTLCRPRLKAIVSFALPVLTVWIVNISGGDLLNVISSQGGINFYIGNGPRADGYTAFATLPGGSDPAGNTMPYSDNIQAAAGYGLPGDWTGSRISSEWTYRTLSHMLRTPVETFLLTGRKLLFLMSPIEIPSNYDPYYFRAFSPVLRLLLHPGPLALPFLVLWALLPGAIVAGRLRKEEFPLLLWTGTLLIGVLLFFVTARFRLPAVPFLLLFLVMRASRNARRTVLLCPVGIAAGIALALFTGGTVRSGGVNMPFFDGLAHVETGDLDRAESLFEEALSRASSRTDGIDLNRSDAMYNLGVIAAGTGRPEDARSWWNATLEYNPDFLPAREALSLLDGLD